MDVRPWFRTLNPPGETFTSVLNNKKSQQHHHKRHTQKPKGEVIMKSLDVLIAVLLIVGGLNWGLVGVLHFDLVGTIFGDMSALSRIVYSVVGLAAVYQAFGWKTIQRRWATAKP
jgi:uncharacterized protein